jgi:hypothetical protein
METVKLHMHPDEERDIARPADLLLTDPKPFRVVAVQKIGSPDRLKPEDPDYPFVPDDETTTLVGNAKDVGGDNPDERFQKKTPQLKGRAGDGFKAKEYRLEWTGTPQGEGPHFKVFP